MLAGRAAFYVKYDLEDRLGAGAFGEAWRVRRRKVCCLYP